jgi:hypothetical protein
MDELFTLELIAAGYIRNLPRRFGYMIKKFRRLGMIEKSPNGRGWVITELGRLTVERQSATLH